MSGINPRKCFLSSAYRESGNPSNYIIALPNDIVNNSEKMRGYSVNDMVLTNTMYPVNSNHNIFYYSINGVSGTVYTATITKGSYNITDFMTELKTQINATTAGIVNAIAVNQNYDYKIKITCEATKTIRVYTLYEIKTTVLATDNVNEVNSYAGFNGSTETTSTFTSSGGSVVSNDVYNLGGDSTIYLNLSINNNSTAISNNINSNSIAYSLKMPSFGEQNSAEIISQQDDIILVPNTLDRFVQVWLTDNDGNTIDMWTDWTFSLDFFY